MRRIKHSDVLLAAGLTPRRGKPEESYLWVPSNTPLSANTPSLRYVSETDQWTLGGFVRSAEPIPWSGTAAGDNAEALKDLAHQAAHYAALQARPAALGPVTRVTEDDPKYLPETAWQPVSAEPTDPATPHILWSYEAGFVWRLTLNGDYGLTFGFASVTDDDATRALITHAQNLDAPAEEARLRAAAGHTVLDAARPVDATAAGQTLAALGLPVIRGFSGPWDRRIRALHVPVRVGARTVSVPVAIEVGTGRGEEGAWLLETARSLLLRHGWTEVSLPRDGVSYLPDARVRWFTTLSEAEWRTVNDSARHERQSFH